MQNILQALYKLQIVSITRSIILDIQKYLRPNKEV